MGNEKYTQKVIDAFQSAQQIAALHLHHAALRLPHKQIRRHVKNPITQPILQLRDARREHTRGEKHHVAHHVLHLPAQPNSFIQWNRLQHWKRPQPVQDALDPREWLARLGTAQSAAMEQINRGLSWNQTEKPT